jgi:hypothetical protein
VYVRVTAGGVTCQSANAATATATVQALPTISNHPASQAKCGIAMQPTLSVTAASNVTNNATLSYQWKSGSGSGSNVGANTNSYAPWVSVTSTFWVVVTNSLGCTATSNTATVTVQTPGLTSLGSGCSAYAAGTIGN